MISTSVKGYLDSLPRSGGECRICFDTRSEGPEAERVVSLTCGHPFGDCCLYDWFTMEMTPTSYGSCPICCKRLFKDPVQEQFLRSRFWLLVLFMTLLIMNAVVDIATTGVSGIPHVCGPWFAFPITAVSSLFHLYGPWFAFPIVGVTLLLRLSLEILAWKNGRQEHERWPIFAIFGGLVVAKIWLTIHVWKDGGTLGIALLRTLLLILGVCVL